MRYWIQKYYPTKITLINVLGIVLKALGYQLSIKPIETESAELETYSDALEGQKTSAQVAENPTTA